MQKIKMGILAAGGIAKTMAETMIHMDQVEAYGVASRDLKKAEQFAGEFGFSKAYGSYEELVMDKEVELIYIASPHSHHYEHIKLCLEHGKHVLCEKSFTVNARQAEEVLTMAKEKDLLLAEAMWVRYLPMVKTLREIIDSNIIGEISTVTANLHYVIDDVPRIVDPELAGGALLDVGVYTLTFASIVMGNHIWKTTAAAVETLTGVDAQTSITLTYPAGKMAVLNCGTMAISDRRGVIYGRKGYIVVENINNFEAIEVYSLDRKLIKKVERPEQITGFEYQVEACVKAICQGHYQCVEMPHSEILHIMEQMDEVRRQLDMWYPFELTEEVRMS